MIYVALLLIISFLLILLNAFFVLAEFAIVKVRASAIEVLVSSGSKKAKLLKHIRKHIDEYLSVCQIGITFASIGLGFVGELSFAKIFSYLLSKIGIASSVISHTFAIGFAYVLVSFLHILLGELVPKSIAIRKAEGVALFSAYWLRFFKLLFFIPLFILNNCANAILHLCGISQLREVESLSQDEIKVIMKSSYSHGAMSFLRLLLVENILDLWKLKVKDAMKPKNLVKTLDTSLTYQENINIIKESKYSRYPLIDGNVYMPSGVVHIKDIILNSIDKPDQPDLRSIARSFTTTYVDVSLENLLMQLQKSRQHLAIVVNKKGQWIGIITLEDIIEEIIGTVEDEFEKDSLPSLSEIINMDRIFLDIESTNFQDAIKEMLLSIKTDEAPVSKEKIVSAVLQHEKAVESYVGNNLAIPHARIDGLKRPWLIFGRSKRGINIYGRDEKVHFIFILLTPLSLPSYQPKLISRIYSLMRSEYVYEQLYEARTPQDVLNTIKTADTVSIS